MSLVDVKIEGHIARIVIQRPEALNALNPEVLSELSRALDDLKVKFPDQVRVALLTGSGEKAFVAGADIRAMTQMSAPEAKAFSEAGQKVFRKIENSPFPVIAVVNGFALGGGLELALSCDFIMASENAKLGLPEVGLGLIPGFGGTVRLSRVVGLNTAREMILTGDPIPAARALEIGLVTSVHPLPELLSAALAKAQKIASRGPLALQAAKKLVVETHAVSVDQAMQMEAGTFSELFLASDVREGTSSFIEKRAPQFKGR